MVLGAAGRRAGGPGLNKQLDLQSLLTQIARRNALQNGWYEERRAVQAAFLTGLAIIGGSVLTMLAIMLRHRGRAVRAAGFGIAALTIFVVARAVSFHHIDDVLGWRIGDLAINAVIEMSGIALVAIGAALRQQAHRAALAPVSDSRFPQRFGIPARLQRVLWTWLTRRSDTNSTGY